jgi:transcription elongation GreA/GreB family factor
LLGMREGETISWSTRYGDIRWLKVVKVIGRD